MEISRPDHRKHDQAPMQSEGEPPKNTTVHGRERPTGIGSSGEQAHSKQSSGSGSGTSHIQGDKHNGSKHSRNNHRRTYCYGCGDPSHLLPDCPHKAVFVVILRLLCVMG